MTTNPTVAIARQFQMVPLNPQPHEIPFLKPVRNSTVQFCDHESSRKSYAAYGYDEEEEPLGEFVPTSVLPLWVFPRTPALHLIPPYHEYGYPISTGHLEVPCIPLQQQCFGHTASILVLVDAAVTIYYNQCWAPRPIFGVFLPGFCTRKPAISKADIR